MGREGKRQGSVGLRLHGEWEVGSSKVGLQQLQVHQLVLVLLVLLLEMGGEQGSSQGVSLRGRES